MAKEEIPWLVLRGPQSEDDATQLAQDWEHHVATATAGGLETDLAIEHADRVMHESAIRRARLMSMGDALAELTKGEGGESGPAAPTVVPGNKGA